ncbi:potassium/sodium hyperpolarization-activated cyclic nucleotide-gated channel 1-like [Tribolium madens]|uniref:potassium/sodium hyperpolarization-activated cyclic nucleotide-gated channel 1-like n=1 Tax=Tribolium madens TaxID=41895 RepID=UPI001CF73180|nr:potassium/sodium hyperpolarization-activated cyclic nucleotide-gated channel 1-like [Tribolium madens]
MFQVKLSHVCTIEHVASRSFLPPLPPKASCFARFKRVLKKIILITEINPNSMNFFRSTAEILDERRQQVKSGSWVIHPFSIFRLYYEIYMAILLFFWLIYLPLDAAYGDYLALEVLVFNWFFNTLGVIDIFVNFTTGYKSKKKETIVMKCSSIAGNYIFSFFFVGDVLALTPELPKDLINHHTDNLLDMLSLAKTVRILTYLDYLETVFSYFRIKTGAQTVIKMATLAFLLIHDLACIFPMMATASEIFESFTEDEERHQETNHMSLNLHIRSENLSMDFFSLYIRNLYTACSYILGVDIRFKYHYPWSFYITAILGYFIGKFLLLFATVVIINMLKSRNNLEIKYFAMMSQVDDYMKAKNFPIVVQKRLRECYLYKYREKYFKEHGVKNFISEKLKKEINYHTCRRLVNNVQIFQSLTRELVEEILHHLKPEIYLPNDIIVKAGSEGDCMYFLASGTVSVVSPSGKEICHLEDGDYFGEICLLYSNLKRTATVIALEISEVYKLDRKSFKKSMENNLPLFKKLQADAKKRYRETRDIERMFMTASHRQILETQSIDASEKTY